MNFSDAATVRKNARGEEQRKRRNARIDERAEDLAKIEAKSEGTIRAYMREHLGDVSDTYLLDQNPFWSYGMLIGGFVCTRKILTPLGKSTGVSVDIAPLWDEENGSYVVSFRPSGFFGRFITYSDSKAADKIRTSLTL